MKKCNKCNIKFNTSNDICPLCQNKLIGNEYEEIFPKYIYKNKSIILKILTFISLVFIIISIFLELYISNDLFYTKFIVSGLIANYIIIYFILKNKQDILELFGKFGMILIIIQLLWYILLRDKVITNYIIPSICFFEILFNFISFLVLKKNYIINYLKLILLNLFLLLIPIILILLKLTTYKLLSLICLIFALIIILWLIIFYFDDIKNELAKIFNI